MGTEVKTIPRIRNVYYATYANLPTTGLKAGDLGYATDRLVFYRWSGAAWQSITIHSSAGVAANIPAAAGMPEGSLYHETDTGKLKQVQAGAWVEISVTPRFGLGQLEFTANKLLLGAGVGADPTEVDPGAKITSGTYTGDNNDNRAIPHGLGVIPKFVAIMYAGAMTTDPKYFGFLAGCEYFVGFTGTTDAVTARDTTNFYVPSVTPNFNSSGDPFAWIAIG